MAGSLHRASLAREPTFGYRRNKFRVLVDYGAADERLGLASTYVAIGEQRSSVEVEDLMPKDTIFFDAFTTLTERQAVAFIDALALLYAGSWNGPETGDCPDPESCAGENRRTLHETYFPSLFDSEREHRRAALARGRARPRQTTYLVQAKRNRGR